MAPTFNMEEWSEALRHGVNTSTAFERDWLRMMPVRLHEVVAQG